MSRFPAPSAYLERPADAPWMVGVAHVGGGSVPYPLSLRDVERDTDWALRVYDWLGLVPGGTLHLIGEGAHEVSWWPFENAAMRRRMPWVQAEAGEFDASRTDMILRRFDLQAVIGLSAPIVDYLLAQGRDLPVMLAHKQVVATPTAATMLEAIGVPAWRLVQLGPVLAFESPQRDGARYDDSEWRVDQRNGELTLTSLNARAAPFAGIRTGVRGDILEVESGGRVERRIALA